MGVTHPEAMLFQNVGKRQRRGAIGWTGPLPWKVKGRRSPAFVAGEPSPAVSSDDEESTIGALAAPDHVPSGVRGIDIKSRITTASFAFRGYDVANLGRTPELLSHHAYGPTVRRHLDEASQVAADTLHRPFDLAKRAENSEATSLETFAEDIAMIVAMELAQISLLEEFFGVEVRRARQSFGYSIGEMASMVLGGVFTMEQLLPIPLACADDCAELARDTTLGVLFSRGAALELDDVQELCMSVSSEGHGMVGASSYLSPNTVLIIGQGETLSRLEKTMPDFLPEKVMLRRKAHQIPPLHTPIVCQRNVPNRAEVALYKIVGTPRAPSPPVVSCVTGTASYDAINARDTLARWVDHPQLLWDVIDETLQAGVDSLIHVGPAPNLIPATFERLSNNISKQLGNRYLQMLGRSVGSSMHRHAWLSRLLPSRAALLRAPHVKHVILEDWLLEQEVV
jgi:[acyl-carrier-protein] S-malonyltransferase